MKKHNYTALTSFRGWSEEQGEWIYGGLYGKSIITADFYPFPVHPDSIGVYTGKDDKEGEAIFCGVAGAKYGGDNIRHCFHDKDKNFRDGKVIFSNGFVGILWGDEKEISIHVPFDAHKITSTQWEEHLKATK